MKEETAVQWLQNCLPVELLKDNYIKAILKTAKEKEKQQLIDCGVEFSMHSLEMATEKAKEYYDIMYKK